MKTAVVGIGNLLLGDDGVGVWLVQRLRDTYRFDPPIELLDGGTLGLGLIAHLADCDRLLVIDAAATGAAPGTVSVLRDAEVPAVVRAALSAHEASLCDLLGALTLLGKAPRAFVAVGIEPATIEPAVALSAPVEAALHRAERETVAQLERWGISVSAARRVVVEGVVQGVGFRPFVHGLAARHELAGWVRNVGGGVEAVVEGRDAHIEAFLSALVASPPPLARITGVRSAPETPAGRQGFAIVASATGRGTQPIPADVALCDDCRRELRDPADRRYRYPFINCTNCGPRYTVIEALPYDRERTTMRGFPLCAPCRAEYEDPASRRFHAEPIACPDCGPRLSFSIAEARAVLMRGGILALKGLGGYHLACDARNRPAVARLRDWKERGDKPLAIMVRDCAELDRVAVVDPAATALLTSPIHPIVLLPRRSESGLAPEVAPGLDTIGVMLPYTPLHELLLEERADAPVPAALVMTSGNRSASPMIVDDAAARTELGAVADAVLAHDRPIAARVDDAVSQIVAGVEVPLRRARGYAPLPLPLPVAVPPLLACGADLKNAFALADGTQAMLSPHVGDLGDYDTYRAYADAVAHLGALLGIEPAVVAHDLHPEYWSTRFAAERYPDRPRIAVQHHHAHVAACLAEHGLRGPAIGVAFDGTGYGPDGAAWGGEFLVASDAAFERVAHLAYVPLLGGERAIREPFRMALAHLAAAGIAWDERLPPVRALAESERRVLRAQFEHGPNAIPTSSAGRLFDAVAALVGVRMRASYEAQAAIELEALADPRRLAPYPFAVRPGAPMQIDVGPVMRAIVGDLDAGVAAAIVAGRFHDTLAALVRDVCRTIRRRRGLEAVALSGGVFQNARLTRSVADDLAADGFTVYRHHEVPPNDGGIAFGQAVVAAARLAT